MIKLGLIGTPIAHSLSPSLHKGFMNSVGLQGSYELFEMEQLPSEGLRRFMKNRQLTGLNVTIPFKEQVVHELDEIDESAEQLRTVNTIVVENEKLIGYNTDVFGIAKSLDKLAILPKTALVFGSGGASKAVVDVLDKRGCIAQIFSRSDNGNSYESLHSEEARKHLLWVNCTPVGTRGVEPHLLPLPYAVLNEEFAIFDLVYIPNPTPFMNEGLKRGAKVIGGEIMLNEQAKKSWLLFHDAYYRNL